MKKQDINPAVCNNVAEVAQRTLALLRTINDDMTWVLSKQTPAHFDESAWLKYILSLTDQLFAQKLEGEYITTVTKTDLGSYVLVVQMRSSE